MSHTDTEFQTAKISKFQISTLVFKEHYTSFY
jgi:hypothetical protein